MKILNKSIFLITGKPGIGKTTLIKKLISFFNLKNICGFYTEEIRERNVRVGFKIITFYNGEGILAHINFFSPYKISKYYVDIQNFEKLVIPELSLAKEKKIVFIDEIGKMELFSEKFKEKVIEIFNLNKIIIATIPISKIDFIESLKSLPKVKVYEITFENRNQMLEILKEEIDKFLRNSNYSCGS
ncbi:MAG: NTPase [candidate division WOR-3 bacterium]|nr:NTPase [candidate division WOR-3 bacterium]MCX7836370.1 NTPase [candidate division WOR-3 bacterium]MDW8113525.1 NTPase [candidate division WOR-3 bacterium]